MKLMQCDECGLRYGVEDRDARERELMCADGNCDGDVVDVEELAEDDQEDDETD